MAFFLQQGYGMKQLNEEFANKFSNLGVILSPRSLQRNTDIENLEEHSKKLKKKGANILFDPQFYEPRTNLEKILQFPYFEGLDYLTLEFNSQVASKFSINCLKYQDLTLQTDQLIIPNIYSNSFNDDWISIQEYLIDGGLKYDTSKKKYLSLPLGPDLIRNKNAFDELISIYIQYEDIDGFYVVLKSPSDYLISDENYLYSVLDAFTSLNLSGKEIILGYANQQSLIYGAAGVSIIASGNYRNVRTFDPDIFYEDDTNEDIRRRGIWYYDPNTLGEYRPQELSLAFNRGLRNFFDKECEYCEMLISSDQPANIPWNEPLPFKHYLLELRRQWLDIARIPLDKRIDYIISFFEGVEENNERLRSKGFRFGRRSFNSDVIESTLNALYAFKSDRIYDLKQLKDFSII